MRGGGEKVLENRNRLGQKDENKSKTKGSRPPSKRGKAAWRGVYVDLFFMEKKKNKKTRGGPETKPCQGFFGYLHGGLVRSHTTEKIKK